MRTDQRSGEAGASEHEEIRREDRRAHVGVEAASAFPHAPRETEDALQERDASFAALTLACSTPPMKKRRDFSPCSLSRVRPSSASH